MVSFRGLSVACTAGPLGYRLSTSRARRAWARHRLDGFKWHLDNTDSIFPSLSSLCAHATSSVNDNHHLSQLIDLVQRLRDSAPLGSGGRPKADFPRVDDQASANIYLSPCTTSLDRLLRFYRSQCISNPTTMSASHDPTRAPTVQETKQDNDVVADTIAYARQTYKGGQKNVKVEPEKYGAALSRQFTR